MTTPEFKSFPRITRFENAEMTITQKLHGTNAQVCIFSKEDGELDIVAGCRTRWLSLEDDNYGFAEFVETNKQLLINALGVGRFFGEWAGPGINSGEGLKEKKLFLFNWRKFKEVTLPNKVAIVPVLYEGAFSFDAINDIFAKLKENGSFIVPGFMHPEGIVIDVDGSLYKKVYKEENTQWEKKQRAPRPELPDISHLLQPIRLEKLLSKDERYIREFPKSVAALCAAYVQDLKDDEQLTGDEDRIKLLQKALSKQLFAFINAFIKKNK